MPDNVIDLDILRPKKRLMKIGGKEIDISYIPAGITFDVDEIVQEMSLLNMAEVQTNKKETKKAFDLSIKLCSVFCEYRYPEMNKKWIGDNLDVRQIQVFAETIKLLLTEAYKGAEEYASKNAEAVKN